MSIQAGYNWTSSKLKGIFKDTTGTSLAVQWLRLRASTAGGMGLIPGQGTKIPHAARCSKNKKRHHKENEKASHILGKYICNTHILQMTGGIQNI